MRGRRRVLVAGSQCRALRRLDFIPDLDSGACEVNLPEALYRVLTDPDLGGCEDALGGHGPLINPTKDQLNQAITDAWRRAAAEEDTCLLLCYVGHGEVRDKFYLRQVDSRSGELASTSVPLIERLRELFHEPQPLTAVGLVLDTCQAGSGLHEGLDRLRRELGALHPSFNILAAAEPGQAAYRGQLTQKLVALLRAGDAGTRAEQLSFEQVADTLRRQPGWAHGQQPVFTVNAAGLYLARNRAAGGRHPLAGTGVWDQVRELTACLQPPPLLDALAGQLGDGQHVAVLDVMGAGKSTVAAALADRSCDGGPLVHGLVLCSAATTPEATADQLHGHLRLSVPGFGAAVEAHRASMPLVEFQALDPVERLLSGPLAHLGRAGAVRVACDGLDQLADAPPVLALLDRVAQAGVRLLVTARTGTPLPESVGADQVRSLGRASTTDLRSYLATRGVTDQGERNAIIAKAAGNWLLCARMADRVLAGTDPDRLPDGRTDPAAAVDELYTDELADLRAARPDDAAPLDRVLGILAVAGPGVATPLDLLADATARLGGPAHRDLVRRVLALAPGLVVRLEPNRPRERVALFHDSLAAHLVNPRLYPDRDVDRIATALLDAIDEFAPPGVSAAERVAVQHLHDYASRVEPELCWQRGEHDLALTSLYKRPHPLPIDNLATWERWHRRAEAELGAEHPDTLTTRGNIAFCTGEVGDAREALRLFTALLPDHRRVLGADHPDTRRTRDWIRYYEGRQDG